MAHGAHTEESGNRNIDADVPRSAAWAFNDAGEQWDATPGGAHLASAG